MDFAVWGHPYTEFPAGQDNPADFLRQFERMKVAGIGIYIPFVMTHGQHYFESKVLGPPSRDLLAPCLEAADKVGIEVHPIVGLGACGVASAAAGRLYDPGPDAAELPSWARDWPCAVWPENRRATCEVAADLLQTYKPDGLALDYLRYPNSAVLNDHPCHCDRCQAEREGWLGHPLPTAEELAQPGVVHHEVQMRCHAVKLLLYGLREVADDVDVPLSLAARARYLTDAVAEGQDWAQWCSEGLLDFVCPMSYNDCFDRFTRFVHEHLHLVRDTGVPLYCGIGRKSSLGTITADEMAAQIRYAMEQGADGVCLFHLAACEDADYAVLEKLSREL